VRAVRLEQPEHLEKFRPQGAVNAQVVLAAPPFASPTRLAGWWERLQADQAFLYAFNLFWTHRLLLFALGALFAVLVPVSPPMGDDLLRDVNPYFWGPGFLFLAPWQRWDTNWYVHIAQLGYQVGDGTTNFPPLYPLLVGTLGRLLLGQYMAATLLISGSAYVVAFVYLYKLTARLFDAQVAQRTLVFLASFPSAFFLLGGYTESLYLALAVASFYYAEEKRWGWVAILAGLAGITRLQGVVLVVPLAYMFLKQQHFNWRKLFSTEAVALLAAPLSFAFYMAYVYLVMGDWNFGNHLLIIWHIKFVMPWQSLWEGFLGMLDPNNIQNSLYNTLDLAMLIFFICLTIVWAQKKWPPEYWIYNAVSICIYLTRASTEDLFWMSMTRYLVVLFPAFILLAQTAPRWVLRLSVGLQIFFATLFIFWMWAG
jgi:Gpi18-like mannosyltransferase